MTRTLALAALACLACAPKQARPTTGAAIVHAVGDDHGHGVLLFRHPSPEQRTHLYLARHTLDGAIRWQLELPDALRIDDDEAPIVVGDSVLLHTADPEANDPDGLVHVNQGDATLHTWSAQQGPSELVTTIGDARQIFAIWRAAGPYRQKSRLEIAAFDPATGERTWSVDDHMFGLPIVYTRLDLRWLLVGRPDADWQALRRSDGARVPLPVADFPGMCHAADTWWATRDDHLLALDLRGETPTHRAALAEFLPAHRRQQWSLVDCDATATGEVVLQINHPYGGLIVGLDPTTMKARWDLDTPHAFGPVPTAHAHSEPRLGPTMVIDQAGGPCVVDLREHTFRWCARWSDVQIYRDGEDTVLRGHPEKEGGTRDIHLVHVRGTDGEVTAAATIRDPARARDAFTGETRDGKLWLALEDLDPTHADQVPLLVLDARTLAPADPDAFGRAGALASLHDSLSELEQILPRWPYPSFGPERPHLVDADPWAHAIDGPAEAAPGSRQVELHARILAVARESAGLPPDVVLRPLAWRDELVVAFAEHEGRWYLVHGSAPAPVAVDIRGFDRRPTAADVYNFVLARHAPLPARDESTKVHRGESDPAAWLALVGAPRDPDIRWQLPDPNPAPPRRYPW